MKKIKLTKGQTAIVDDEDFEYVSSFTWCAVKSKYQMSYYAQRRVGGEKRLQFMHQIIAAKHGIIKGNRKVCDHIDRNGLNNQKHNLRPASFSQNSANVPKRHKNTTSKYKGVCFETSCNRWRARIKVNYKSISLGCYATAEEAAIAYNKGAIKYFKQFAFLNIIN